MKKQALFAAMLAVGLSVATGCSYMVPSETHSNACEIYDFDSDWKEAAEASAAKWGTPAPILLAFVKQESAFVKDARPPKDYYMGIIPYQRSSAYGYAQAKDEVWLEYQQKTKNYFASREDIEDALDFIGWYNHHSYKANKISKTDAYNLYLAYHEGNGGYAKKSFNKKAWLLKVAKKVQNQAATYQHQLKHCSLPVGKRKTTMPDQPNPPPKANPTLAGKQEAVPEGHYYDINTQKVQPCNAPWPFCR